MSSHKRLFLKASIIISIAIILSRVFGMLREQYTLFLFGAGWDMDAYISASRIPSMFRNLLGEGAFSAVFISIFSTMLVQNREQAREFTNKVISWLAVISLAVSAIGVVTAPFYLKLLHKSTVNFDLVVYLTYYIMPFLSFISISAIFMGILNSLEFYFIPALAPVFGNIAYLLTVFLLNQKMGVASLGLAFLVSSLVDMLIQIPFIIRKGFGFKFNFKIDDQLKFFFKSFIPVAFGMAVFQFNRLISNVFSSSIEGGNTLVEKAFIVIQMIIAVLITGISTVSLPLIAKGENQTTKTSVIYLDSLKFIFLIIFPASVFCLSIGEELISFIYKDLLVAVGIGAGKISDETIKKMGEVLFYFAPGMLFFSLITIVNRGFQGMKLFYLPVIGSIISVVCNYILMSVLVSKMNVFSIPIALSLSAVINFAVLFFLFHRKNPVNYTGLLVNASKSVIAGTALYFALLPLKAVQMKLIFKVPLMLLEGITAYFVALLLLRQQETVRFSYILIDRIKRWLKIKSSG